MSHRFFISRRIDEEKIVFLEGDEARHLSKVMRKKSGDRVQLFDGSGFDFEAEIREIQRDRVELNVLDRRESECESKISIILACALPKGERQKWMIEKLTELGCSVFIPLCTEFGVAKADSKVIERLQRNVIESSKQCGRSRLMQIMSGSTLQELSEQWNGESTARIVLHPKSDENVRQISVRDWMESLLCKKDENRIAQIVVLIGPEGGFSSAEIRAAVDSGWVPVDLGPRILRVETAAIAVCSVLGLFPDRGRS